MPDARTKEQGEAPDGPEQGADQVESENKEKIALWLARARRHPLLAAVYFVFCAMGVYALLSGKAFDSGVLINGVVIFVVYRCVVAFIAKPHRDGVTRNDKK